MRLLKISLVLTCLNLQAVYADMIALDEFEMSQSTGEGLGFAIEDFVFDASSAEATLTGIENSNGDEVKVEWSELYIMGEGSENGTIETTANIGSYIHPWLIETTTADNFTGFGFDGVPANELAVFQFKTDEYENVVENSGTYSTWSFYQGCVWGQDGCNDASIASDGIAAVVNDLDGDRIEIATRYNNDLASLNSTIILDIQNVIEPQEVVVVEAEEQLAVDKTFAEERYADPAIEQYFPGLVFGEEAGSCPLLNFDCINPRDAYNDSLAVYFESIDNLSAENRELARLYDETLDGNGISLNNRLRDQSEYITICGTDATTGGANSEGCGAGLLAIRLVDKENIDRISEELTLGVVRRKGLDIGSAFKFTLVDSNTGETREDYLNIDMKGVTFDGSYIRFWGRNAKDESGVFIGEELVGEINFQIFAKELNISTCGPTCTLEQINNSTLYFDNFYMRLALGYGDVQPLRFNVTSDGQFQLELPKITKETAEDFYANAPKSYVSVGNINLGGANDLGGVTIDGLRASYLKVTTHDL